MSYAMIHYIIANEFSKELNIEEKPIFLLASIAPDAVHARKDFNLLIKADSHFLQREETWGEVITEEPMVIWYQNIKNAYKQRINSIEDKKECAFLKGYFLHILTDIFNSKLFYGRFLARYGIENVLSFREKYKTECILQDNFLYHTYPESADIVSNLQKAMCEDLSGDFIKHLQLDTHITKENLFDATTYQIEMFERTPYCSLDNLLFVSEKRTADFIKEVKAECKRLLFDFPDCERTFRMDD